MIESPLHTSVAEALIVGIGALLTSTVVAADTAEQPFPSVQVTKYVPELVTVIDELVNVLDQTFPDGWLDVNTTEPPVQNEVGPFAEIVGADGLELTVTTVGIEVAVQPLLSVYVNVYVPEDDTVTV